LWLKDDGRAGSGGSQHRPERRSGSFDEKRITKDLREVKATAVFAAVILSGVMLCPVEFGQEQRKEIT